MADAAGGRAPGSASSRVSSEYNRVNRKSRVAGASRHATPPRAFGNPGGPPPGQPFRHTQVRDAHKLAAPMHRPNLFVGDAQSVIAETEPVHGWLPHISSPRESGSAQWFEDKKGAETPRRSSSRTPSIRSAGAVARSAKGSPVMTPLHEPKSENSATKNTVFTPRGPPAPSQTSARRVTPGGGVGGGFGGGAVADVPAGFAYPHPPNFQPAEDAHPDGWVKRPRHKTKTSLMKSYEKSRLPDPTYDVDGDGVVSTKDLYLASKFDVNGDGVLQEDEVFELRSQMVDDILRVYNELPHAGDTRKIRGIMQEFRERRDEVIMDESFRKKMNALQVNLKSQTMTDSRQLYQSLKARQIPPSYDALKDEEVFAEQLAFDKKWGFKPRS